ncbi:MAG: NPCBM/NEW2 domain-containing protein [Planctomycetota bacterium]|nr:NPCBM/NEW2 domain-containing protein [Planctomycetota bacterium]
MKAKLAVAAIGLLVLASGIGGDEILFHDGQWLTAMIDGATPDGKLNLRLTSGETRTVAVEDIVAIYFKGRETRSIRSGMQEFRLVSGDRIRGRIVAMKGDDLHIQTHAAGDLVLPMEILDGFISLPIVGRSGRRAEQLFEARPSDFIPYADTVLDRRATSYEGVIETANEKNLRLDLDRMMQSLDMPILYLAGVRLAEKEKMKAPGLPPRLYLRIHARDGTAVDGYLKGIRHGMWLLQPLCRDNLCLPFPVEEMTMVEVLNGRTLYLSQLSPASAEEKTILAPPHPFKVNANCLGGPIVIGSQEYAWGLGVHANSALTYSLHRNFKKFHASIGVDKQVGRNGSVIFSVHGDGRELFRSGVVRGGEEAVKISVPVEGVDRLTLKVECGEDFDLGDCANWAMARLTREAPPGKGG